MQGKIKILALPNGIDRDSRTLKVSLYIDPVTEATDENTDREYPLPEPFSKWPAFIASKDFSISFNNQEVQVHPDFSRLDSFLFAELIGRLNVKLRPADEQTLAAKAEPTPLSYSVAEAEKSIYSLYSMALGLTQEDNATAAVKEFSISAATASHRNFTGYPSRTDVMRRSVISSLISLHREAGSNLTAPTKGQTPLEISNLRNLLSFHSRTEDEQEKIRTNLSKISGKDNKLRQELPVHEFHERIAQLGEFPSVLKALGFILDVPIPLAGLNLAGDIDLSADIKNSGITVCRFKTKTFVSPGEFYIKSSAGVDILNGMLELNKQTTANYQIVQIDVAGSILKLSQFAKGLDQTAEDAAQFGKAIEPPDSVSIPSLRTVGLSLIHNGRNDAILRAKATAEKNGCASPGTIPEVRAENVIRGYSIDIRCAEYNQGKWASLCDRDIYIGIPGVRQNKIKDEQGWIPAVTCSKEGDKTYLHESLMTWDGWSLVTPRPLQLIPECKELERSPRPAVPGDFNPVIKTPSGSLIPLRYGKTYDMRARLIDLAGNDMSANYNTDDENLPANFYLQAKYLRFEPVNSPVLVLTESLGDNMPGEAIDHMIIRTNTDKKFPVSSERHIFPPKTSVDMAVQLGILDKFKDRPAESYEILRKQDGKLAESYSEAQILTPYIPDPLAVGVLFQCNGQSKIIRFRGDWPFKKSFRVKLAEGEFQLDLNETTNVLTVSLPKGEMAVAKISSIVPEEELPKMGHWDQMSARTNLNKTEIAEGIHWALTPFRSLYLIHAVQQPLYPPTFITDAAAPNSVFFGPKPREFASTSVDLEGSFRIDNKSIGKIELIGSWTDADDDPGKPEPERIPHQAPVYERSLNYDEPDLLNFPEDPAKPVRQVFLDTKYREVTYHAVGTTRFLEQLFTPKERQNGEHLNHQLTKETSEPEKLLLRRKILSSARPAVCAGLYALPLFGWADKNSDEDNQGRKFVSRKRVGGGLRIYMDRGWYSSGANEMLAVVLWPESDNKMPEDLRSLTSGIGSDPIWKTKEVNFRLRQAHFKNRQRFVDGIDLDSGSYTLSEVNLELGKAYPKERRVQVAAFIPEYNKDRQLWYCDIEVDAGHLYFPFIRLALARFQPNSVVQGDRDCHLSKVLLADFIQLAPDRTASITFNSDDKKRVDIVISGPGPSGSVAFNEPNKMEVTIEKRDKTKESGWVPDSIAKLSAADRDGVTVWSGQANLSKKDRHKFRAVIREYENHRSDTSKNEQRLVYADVIELAD